MLLSSPPMTADDTRPAGPLEQGGGSLEVSLVDGASTITQLQARSPLKLLCPRSRGQSAWVYVSSFGGGLVAGDELSLTARLGAGTYTFLSTQSATKVYRSDGKRTCRQSLDFILKEDALLVSLPDPVCCFADARYEQCQRFSMTGSSSLLMLDWFTAGRRARGERWAFGRYRSRTQVRVDSRLTIGEALLLDREDGPIDAPSRMGRFDCMATLLMIGPMLSDVSATLLDEISKEPVNQGASLIAAASPTAGGAILRIIGPGPEAVAQYLRPRLAFLPQLLGDDPLARKW